MPPLNIQACEGVVNFFFGLPSFESKKISQPKCNVNGTQAALPFFPEGHHCLQAYRLHNRCAQSAASLGSLEVLWQGTLESSVQVGGGPSQICRKPLMLLGY